MSESIEDASSLLGIAELEKLMLTESMILELDKDACIDEPEPEELHENSQPPPHPLLNPIVLEKVFAYLVEITGDSEVDDTQLRNLRLVCRAWNDELIRILVSPYTCRSSKDIKDLLHLISNPSSPSPFLRSLCLRYNELWKTPETFQLLWTVKQDLKVLEISAIELEFCPFMILPKVCPGLKKLKLTCTDIYPDVNWSELEPFQENWIRPFPHLRELEIHRGSLTTGSVKLIFSLLERVKSLDVVSIQVDTGFGRDDGIQLFGQELMRHSKIQRLKSLRMESYNCNGFVMGIANEISTPFCVNLHTFSLVQKSGTLFPPVSVQHLEKALSQLVQEAAHSLKHLTVVNSSESPLFQEIPVGKIIFPETMPQLEFICLGNVGLKVDLKKKVSRSRRSTTQGRKGLGGFSTIFPNLVHFEFWIRIFNDITDEDKDILFEAMFPKEEEDRAQPAVGEDNQNGNQRDPEIQKNLRNLHLYTRLKPCHGVLLEKIAWKFTSLRSLMLEMDGELLVRAVGLLKDLEISHFTLIYYETNNGMSEFDSACTGVPMTTCTQLLLESEACVKRDFVDEDALPGIKTEPSFADWKCLTRFNVSYRHGGVIDVVFLTYCLRRMKNLRDLELRHFDIKENLLIRLIKKTELETLVLGNCNVIPLDEDYPVIGHHFGIEDLVSKYKKRVKVNFVGYEGTADAESVPYYAKLLHHFDYDHYVADNN